MLNEQQVQSLRLQRALEAATRTDANTLDEAIAIISNMIGVPSSIGHRKAIWYGPTHVLRLYHIEHGARWYPMLATDRKFRFEEGGHLLPFVQKRFRIGSEYFGMVTEQAHRIEAEDIIKSPYGLPLFCACEHAGHAPSWMSDAIDAAQDEQKIPSDKVHEWSAENAKKLGEIAPKMAALLKEMFILAKGQINGLDFRTESMGHIRGRLIFIEPFY